MAKISIPTLKTKFQTGDRPTQEDYEDLIDSASARSTDLGSMGNNENTIAGIENPTVIDNFDATEWRMVKYIVSIASVSRAGNTVSLTVTPDPAIKPVTVRYARIGLKA